MFSVLDERFTTLRERATAAVVVVAAVIGIGVVVDRGRGAFELCIR